jgi:hypothetical protein
VPPIAWLSLMRPVIVAWPEKAEFWRRKARRGRSAAVKKSASRTQIHTVHPTARQFGAARSGRIW